MPNWMRHTAGVIYAGGILNCIVADQWIGVAVFGVLVLILAIEV